MVTLLKKEISNLRKKTIKSFIDVIMLTELMKKPMTGYDMIVSIQEKFGILVSSGTVYSHLYALERSEIVSAIHSKGKRSYELTEKGAEHLELSFNSIKKTLSTLEQDIDL